MLLVEKLIVTQLLKKNRHFMEHEGSLPYSEEHITRISEVKEISSDIECLKQSNTEKNNLT